VDSYGLALRGLQKSLHCNLVLFAVLTLTIEIRRRIMKRIIIAASLIVFVAGLFSLGLVLKGRADSTPGMMPSAQAADDASLARRLEGTWVSTFTYPDGRQYQSLLTFARGGTLTQTNSIELEPPLPATNGQGVWEKTSGHEFATTYTFFLFDTSLNPAGSVRIRQAITLSGRDAFTAVDQIEVFDPEGNVLGTFCATEQATRMTVQPVTSCPIETPSQTSPADRLSPARGWKR